MQCYILKGKVYAIIFLHMFMKTLHQLVPKRQQNTPKPLRVF